MDFVGRWGGEEFLVVLPDTELDAAINVAKKARMSIEKMVMPVGEIFLQVTLSAGVVSMSRGFTFQELLDFADQALYKSKDYGRNQVWAYRNGALFPVKEEEKETR